MTNKTIYNHMSKKIERQNMNIEPVDISMLKSERSAELRKLRDRLLEQVVRAAYDYYISCDDKEERLEAFEAYLRIAKKGW